MDFLDPNKHREHRRRLFISYFLVASVILMGSYLLFYQTKGFDVNRQTGKVIQNGLVYVSTSPVTAQIYLNGQQLSATTNTKLTIPGGVYGVELRSQGYRTWKGSINLEGGSVERLTYPLLIPKTLKTTDVQLYSSSPGLTTSSPDKRWLLVQQPGSTSIFDNYDLSSFETPPTTLTLAPELLTSVGSDHTMTAIAWADDNRHILVRHDFAGGNEYVLLDREKIDLSVNLSRLISLPGNLVVLRDRHFDQNFDSFIVEDDTVGVDDSIVSVGGERIECNIGNDDRTWSLSFDCGDSTLSQSFRVVALRASVIFFCFRDDRKQGDGFNP